MCLFFLKIASARWSIGVRLMWTLFSSVMQTNDIAFIFMNNKSAAQTTVVDSVLQFYKSLFVVSRVWFLSFINKMPKYFLKFLSPLVFYNKWENSLALWRAFVRLHHVTPLHAKTFCCPWSMFLARWRTNPFICMARYTSLHLLQDWDCVWINSWLMSCHEAVPTGELANT